MLALGLVGASAPLSVRAEPEASSVGTLKWDAPVGCPSADEADARLRDRLAAGVPMPDVRAIVRLHGATYSAQIEIRAGDVGTYRELGSPSCETLLDVTTLLAATIADEAASASREDEAPAGETIDAGVPVPPVVTEPVAPASLPRTSTQPRAPAPAATPPPRPSIELHADARVSSGIGVAPDIDVAAGGALGVSMRHAAVELGGSIGVPRAVAVVENARIRVSWWSLEARGCGRITVGAKRRVHALPCVALLGGGHDSAGDGDALRRSHRQRDGWIAAALGPMLTVDLGRRLGLVAGAEALAFLRRPAAAIEPLGEVLRVRPVGVRAFLGLRVRFSVTDRATRTDVGP